jgi:Citrate synthase, C-terminal domain
MAKRLRWMLTCQDVPATGWQTGVTGCCRDVQVAYLLVYGHLPLPKELARWEEAVMRHSAVPVTVVRCSSCRSCLHEQWPDMFIRVFMMM